MITLITGNDTVGIRNFIKSRTKAYKPDSIHNFEGKEYKNAEILDIAYGNSMFDDKTLIIISPSTVSEIEFKEAFLQDLHSILSTELVVTAGTLNKNSKQYKLFKKYAKLHDFVMPKDYANFNIVDALFINNDKVGALKLISGIENIDSDIFPLIGLLNKALRDYFSMKYNNESWKKSHPYVRRKVSSFKNLDEEKVKKIYIKLHQLDVRSKTTGESKMALLQDFVLYSI